MNARLRESAPAPDSGAGERTTDLVFAVSGSRLPADHAAALWDALLARLPWLAAEPAVGVHAIRAASDDAGLLLSRRARLVLRLPLRRQADAVRLSGQQLEVCGERLAIGAARPRPLVPWPSLTARFVATGAGDDRAHQEAVEAMLDALGMPVPFICGRLHPVAVGGIEFVGAELVVHQLHAAQSLAFQECGLGSERHFGHGLFLPHKTIGDLA